MWSGCETRGGTEFSRFLPLATDEGESQAVGGPCVSFVSGFVTARRPDVTSSLFGTALSDVSGQRAESEMKSVIGT